MQSTKVVNRKEVRKVARRNNEIPVNKGIMKSMAEKVKEAIGFITEKDSLSAGDTKAIRILTDVYDILLNPVKENPVFSQDVSIKTEEKVIAIRLNGYEEYVSKLKELRERTEQLNKLMRESAELKKSLGL